MRKRLAGRIERRPPPQGRRCFMHSRRADSLARRSLIVEPAPPRIAQQFVRLAHGAKAVRVGLGSGVGMERQNEAAVGSLDRLRIRPVPDAEYLVWIFRRHWTIPFRQCRRSRRVRESATSHLYLTGHRLLAFGQVKLQHAVVHPGLDAGGVDVLVQSKLTEVVADIILSV